MKAYYCELQCRSKTTGELYPLIVSTLAENEDDARALIKDSMNYASAESNFGEIKEGILYKDVAVFPVGIAKEDVKPRA